MRKNARRVRRASYNSTPIANRPRLSNPFNQTSFHNLQGVTRRRRKRVDLRLAEDRRYSAPEARVHRALKNVYGIPSGKLRVHVIRKPKIVPSAFFFTAKRSQYGRSGRRPDVPRLPAADGPWASAFKLPAQVAFEGPARLPLCIRRKQRKEVILAKGKGGAGHRRPRLNQYSQIRC